MPAGFYTLVANCIVNGEDSLAGRMPLHVDSNLANVTVSVSPNVSIPVTFRTNESGADANQNRPVGMVILTQEKRSAHRAAAWSEQEADGDERRMVIKRVESGSYSVDIRPNPGWYVESARYGSVDLLTDDLKVPEGETTEAIEIKLRNDGARVSGNVRGRGAASASGMVLLVPSGAPRLVKVTRIMNGSFTIDDLAPGSYRVIALDRADDLEYTNPEALRNYLTKAQDVTLGPKQESRVDLEAPATLREMETMLETLAWVTLLLAGSPMQDAPHVGASASPKTQAAQRGRSSRKTTHVTTDCACIPGSQAAW